jgi:hypothetical protein
MAQKIRRGLCRLKESLHGVFRKEKLHHSIVLRSSFSSPEAIEERREEALHYLVETYFELKKREEEYIKKLENYGKIRRWFYRRGMNLKYAGVIVKETMVKPAIIYAIICSTLFSILLGTAIGPQIAKFTAIYIPHPFGYVLDVLILFPIGFSPGIISVILNYHIEKKKLKRILEDHGIEYNF